MRGGCEGRRQRDGHVLDLLGTTKPQTCGDSEGGVEQLKLLFRNLAPELRGLETHGVEKGWEVLPGHQGDGAEQVAFSSDFWPSWGNKVWQPGLAENRSKYYDGNSKTGNL